MKYRDSAIANANNKWKQAIEDIIEFYKGEGQEDIAKALECYQIPVNKTMDKMVELTSKFNWVALKEVKPLLRISTKDAKNLNFFIWFEEFTKKRDSGAPECKKDRKPAVPIAIQQEQSFLGGIMLSSDTFFNEIKDNFSESYFINQSHRLIFRAMFNIASRGKTINIITVSDELQRMGYLGTVGGDNYLSELVNAASDSSCLRACADGIIKSETFNKIDNGGFNK